MNEKNERELQLFKQSLEELEETLKTLRKCGRHRAADEVEELLKEIERMSTS